MDARVARYTWTVLLILLFVDFVYIIRETLFVFVVALLFAYLLWPVVNFLDRRLPGRSKVPSLAIVYLVLLSVIVAIAIEAGTRIAGQANDLYMRIPELLSKLEQPAAVGAKQSIGIRLISEIQRQIAEHAQDFILPISNAILNMLSHTEIFLFIVLIPILSFFFLKNARMIVSSLLDIVAKGSNREIFNDVVEDLHQLLARYMRSMVLLGLATSITYCVFFWIIGLPYGLLLGSIAFFFEFIPLIGPLTSAIIILLVAGLSGFGHIPIILIFLGAYRLFQDYVLSPQLLSAGTEVHPLLVIFGVLAGGQLAGIPGAFLSVPVIATLRIIYRQVQKRHQTIDEIVRQ